MDKEQLKKNRDGIVGFLVLAFVVWFFLPTSESAWDIAEKNNKVFSDKTKINVFSHFESGYPKLEEDVLVKAVGLPLERRYQLEDGYGLKFRGDNQPGFNLEFRGSRVNIAWDNYYDSPEKHSAANKENMDVARRVLSAALGANIGKEVYQYYRDLQPAKIKASTREIWVSPSRGSTLVSIN